MRVVVLLAIRNEELYLARCLKHLHSQGIEVCLIDNDSTDRSLEIARTFLGKGVFRIEHLSFNGFFEFQKILQYKEKLAKEIEADWFIHHDADEIREAPFPYKTLLEGIEDVDRQGYNAINFNEFLFLPTCDDESFEGDDYVEKMQYYYFFKSKPLHRVNTWKRTHDFNLVGSGGHCIEFNNKRIFPIDFILRHYIVLSRVHAIRKYTQERIYPQRAVEEFGWHGARARFTADKLKFPDKKRLKRLCGNYWDTSDPWSRHEFLGG
jgi:glycosyltransferase involved in cell wall biosynthesis